MARKEILTLKMDFLPISLTVEKDVPDPSFDTHTTSTFRNHKLNLLSKHDDLGFNLRVVSVTIRKVNNTKWIQPHQIRRR